MDNSLAKATQVPNCSKALITLAECNTNPAQQRVARRLANAMMLKQPDYSMCLIDYSDDDDDEKTPSNGVQGASSPPTPLKKGVADFLFIDRDLLLLIRKWKRHHRYYQFRPGTKAVIHRSVAIFDHTDFSEPISSDIALFRFELTSVLSLASPSTRGMRRLASLRVLATEVQALQHDYNKYVEGIQSPDWMRSVGKRVSDGIEKLRSRVMNAVRGICLDDEGDEDLISFR